jgi:hypothetical protein
MERISKKPTPDCPLCGWSRKDHPMATHEWATKTGECAGEDREPCLLRQLAAANEKLTESARLATESAQLADGLAKDLAAANERVGRLEEDVERYKKALAMDTPYRDQASELSRLRGEMVELREAYAVIEFKCECTPKWKCHSHQADATFERILGGT